MRRTALAAVLVALGVGCSGDEPTAEPAAEELSGETRRETTELGPVSATVAVTPAAPRLGDTLLLSLEVVAEPGVDVEMPVFGEALGRFSILGFTPREDRGADGSTIATQEYRLQAAASGRLRVPPLRVVFVDRRPGQAGDAGVAERELLTEEIAIEVESVLEGDEDRELRAAKGALDPDLGPPWYASVPVVAGLSAMVLLGGLFLVWRSLSRRSAPRVSPYELARRRLAELEARGVPEGEALGDWYVELSAVVRHYLEGRFGLRAPELTTQEFLREAQRSDQLAAEHKELLAEFLEHCDRVKFAGYQPDQGESQRALEGARRFVEETRVVPEEEAAA